MRILIGFLLVVVAFPALADDVELRKRWDIRGFYYATGATMTESVGSSNIALNLLNENSVGIATEAIPPQVTLEAAYLYWSGARETPDYSVKLNAPGVANELIITAKEGDCYEDFDNRTGSLTKIFYTCRADITSVLADGWDVGTYTVRDVDAVILPGGNACTSDKDCWQEANLQLQDPLTSCQLGEETVCICDSKNNKCKYDHNTIGHASFAIVLVYLDPEETQTRSIFLYDGMEAFIQKTVSFDLTDVLTNTPPQGQNNVGKLTYYIVEGDNNNMTTNPDPSCKGLKKDNPGEHVKLAWGTVDEDGVPTYGFASELFNDANPICDDPFNGTAGAGVDIETFVLDVPAGKTVARLDVSSPGLDSVNDYYPDETCTINDNNQVEGNCASDHQCKCTKKLSDGVQCQIYRCVDKWDDDGIGVAFIVLGFDSFVPELINPQKMVQVIEMSPPGQDDGFTSPGDGVKFVVVVANAGDATAPAVHFQVTDVLPLGLSFVGWNGETDKVQVKFSGLPNSSDKDGVIAAEIETNDDTGQETLTVAFPDDVELSEGESVQISFEALVNPDYPWEQPGASLTNTVELIADGIDAVKASTQPIPIQLVDTDNDGKLDHLDNCPWVDDPDQTDTDGDGLGDVCDPDIDGDDVVNDKDACPLHEAYFEGEDADNDGLSNEKEGFYGSNPCDDDSDDDGIEDGEEVSVYSSNPTLCDTDGDGLPDGLEVGVTLETRPDDTKLLPPVAGQCTFKKDDNPESTTDPVKADTDNGGVSDGEEDFNKDGVFDPYSGELDPNDPFDDFSVSGGSRLLNCQTGADPSTTGIALFAAALLGLLLWRHRGVALMLLIAGAMLMPVSGQAQVEVNYNTFRFAGNSKGIIHTEAGQLESPLDFSIALGMSYGHKPLVLRHALTNDVLDNELVEQRVGADLSFSMAFASWFGTDLHVPLIPYQKGSDPITNEEVPSFALGDITFTPRFKIAGSRRGGGFLSLLLPVTFPSGKATKGSYVQANGFSFRPTIAMSAGDVVTWAMNLGVVVRDPSQPFGVEQGYEFFVSTGFEFSLMEDTSFLLIDAYGSTQFDDFFQRQETTPVEVLAAYKHRFRKFYVTVGGGMGVTKGYGVPEWRVMMNVVYASELLDRDGDRIGDDDDQCPNDPEDYDQYQDSDGCPEPDNDNDGILDTKDKCPDKPEDVDGFKDLDGCPDPDNDADGILDVEDECPLQAEDKDNFEDTDGCPELDNDQDSIQDKDDQCPLDKEDLDGWKDQDGCPDPDNDNDGIVDTRDKCPNEPENVNGYKDEDGCPDVVFTCKEFIIPEKVFFRTRSYRILKKSFPLLKVVADTILEHPEAAVLEIQGHSDERGSAKFNKRLSERRARSVMQYLIKQGVTAERLTFKGYGFDIPLEPENTGPEYYDQNRRVQFIVQTLDPTKSERCRR